MEKDPQPMSQDLVRPWLKKVTELKPFAALGDLDKLAEEGERVRDSLTWNTNERANIIQVRNLLMNGAGQEAKRHAERLLQSMSTKTTSQEGLAYRWSEKQIEEVNNRLEKHGSEVRFKLLDPKNPTNGFGIYPSVKDAEEWHMIHRIVDEVLSKK